MSTIFKKNIPLVMMFIIGMFLFGDWFFAIPGTGNIVRVLTDFGNTIAAFALGLGAMNLFIRHGGHLKKRTAGQWYYSTALLVTLFLFILIGILQGAAGPNYSWMYNNVAVPMAATMYGSIAFFIASAAYRALRARTKEATVLLVTGMLLLLKNAPIGGVIWEGFPIIGSWIMDVPSAAAFRGILIGLTLGMLALGVRTLVGIERGYSGQE